MNIVFHAEIFMSSRGFVARAAELGISSPPAGTQRTSLKQLKEAISLHVIKSAQAGQLRSTLKEAGYVSVYEILDRDNEFVPNIEDRRRITLKVPKKILPSSA